MAGYKVLKTLAGHSLERDSQESARQKSIVRKWKQTGLLEGLNNEHDVTTVTRMLEEQAKYVHKDYKRMILNEASGMAAGDVQGFAAVAFPVVRRLFGKLIAKDLVSVQAMNLPSGLIFYFDFVYGDTLGTGSTTSDQERFGNPLGGSQSVYGTDKVAEGVIDGVSLVDSLKGDLGGPYNALGVYSAPTASVNIPDGVAASASFKYDAHILSSSNTDAQRAYYRWDQDIRDLETANGVTNTHCIAYLSVAIDQFEKPDLDLHGAFFASGAALVAASTAFGTASKVRLIRRLTRKDPTNSNNLLFTFVGLGAGGTGTDGVVIANATAGTALSTADLVMSYPQKDNITNVGTDAIGAVTGAAAWGLEFNKDIPEIDLKISSTDISAVTRKLKARWSDELSQDIQAYHNINAESELTNMLTDYMAVEQNSEVLMDLVKGATAGTYYWSRSPGLFVDKTTGAQIGATTAAPDFTGTVREWYETLIETCEDVSAQIHRKTLQGGANFMVCSPEVATILEATAGFAANILNDADAGQAGIRQAGSIKKRFDVYVDPMFYRHVILLGRKGSSFLDSGYVYAPYVAFQTTPVILDPDDFTPRRGVLSRYARKMVRPDMYGLVIVRDLLGGQ